MRMRPSGWLAILLFACEGTDDKLCGMGGTDQADSFPEVNWAIGWSGLPSQL